MSELLLIISALLPSRRWGRKRDTKLTNIPFISHQPDHHAERRDSVFSLGKLTLAYWEHHFSNQSVWYQLERSRSLWQAPQQGLDPASQPANTSSSAITVPPGNVCHSKAACSCVPLHQAMCPVTQHRWEGCDLSVAWSKRKLRRRVTDLCTPKPAYGKWLYETVNTSKIILI